MPANQDSWHPPWIEVAGFKSIREPVRIDLRPLTLLAGANSSGKTSALQPLLLLKQSLDVGYDPDPLVLDGPHVAFTSLDQFLSRGGTRRNTVKGFHVAFGPGPGLSSRDVIHEMETKFFFKQETKSHDRLHAQVAVRKQGGSDWVEIDPKNEDRLLGLMGEDNRNIHLEMLVSGLGRIVLALPDGRRVGFPQSQIVVEAPLRWVASILHLPGHRGLPERRYPRTRVIRDVFHRTTVVGPLHPYAAGLLLEWKQQARNIPSAKKRLKLVNEGMKSLGLTWKVQALAANAAELELRVGRLPRSQPGGARDLVALADVGFGVSQVLPVLVALAAASPGQMVLVEQPELHLHPMAQLTMGLLLAEAAKRGVIVVVETHSQLILRAIQTTIAKGMLKPKEVALHWFSRDEETGWTKVTTAEIKKDGSFGAWPVDFPDVYAMADSEFLKAVFNAGGPE